LDLLTSPAASTAAATTQRLRRGLRAAASGGSWRVTAAATRVLATPRPFAPLFLERCGVFLSRRRSNAHAPCWAAEERAAITFIRNYINYCRVGAGAAASCRERCLEFWRELNFASDHDSAVGSDGCGGVEAEGSWREARRLTVVPHTHTHRHAHNVTRQH
jgi:hypothetical protein